MAWRRGENEADAERRAPWVMSSMCKRAGVGEEDTKIECEPEALQPESRSIKATSQYDSKQQLYTVKVD